MAKWAHACIILEESVRFVRDPTWGQMDEEIRHGRWTKQIGDTMNTRYIENPDVERARCLETLLQLGPIFVPIVVTRNRDRVKFNNHMIVRGVQRLPQRSVYQQGSKIQKRHDAKH